MSQFPNKVFPLSANEYEDMTLFYDMIYIYIYIHNIYLYVYIFDYINCLPTKWGIYENRATPFPYIVRFVFSDLSAPDDNFPDVPVSNVAMVSPFMCVKYYVSDASLANVGFPNV